MATAGCSTAELRIVAFPRDANPYQELLYGAMRALGDEVSYAGERTRSRSLNLLLMPLELALLRLRGVRVFHLHWTFGFSFAGLGRRPGVLRLGRRWFGVVLAVARALGMRVVWTAHNVLPHDPVFDDDLAARRMLVAACDLVIAHSERTLAALADLGARPRRAAVIGVGPTAPAGTEAIGPPRPHDPRTVVFVGRVAAYKGVEDLLEALATLEVPLRCRIAGACADDALSGRLRAAAAALEGTVSLELGFVPDEALVAMLADADAVVLPFRRITTSSSVTLAFAAGRPAIVPDVPELDDVPREATFRHPPGVAGLADALRRVALCADEELRARAQAAREVSRSLSWPAIARATHEAMAAADGGACVNAGTCSLSSADPIRSIDRRPPPRRRPLNDPEAFRLLPDDREGAR
ncbi:MAG TPA: glycosyltransferase family 4 protein [Solirubrobacteraceae bacterium]|nr:glycosyltransferase family 4 protein [Solirubrobacteraceae bacterium]